MEEIKKMLADIASLLKVQNENTKEILNVEEASRYLSLSKSYLYKLAERNELPFFCPASVQICATSRASARNVSHRKSFRKKFSSCVPHRATFPSIYSAMRFISSALRIMRS